MAEDVRDWCIAHSHIFGEVADSVRAVAKAMTRATRLATSRESLTAAEVVLAFARVAQDARACRAIVDEALALPPIPDSRCEVQFRDAMDMRGRWADAIAAAVEPADSEAVGRALPLGVEATRQGALFADALRQAWPDETGQ